MLPESNILAEALSPVARSILASAAVTTIQMHREQRKKAAECSGMFKLTKVYFHWEQKEKCYSVSPQELQFYLHTAY